LHIEHEKIPSSSRQLPQDIFSIDGLTNLGCKALRTQKMPVPGTGACMTIRYQNARRLDSR
jgi:hypothetical protein